mmetsp:Transcript_54755/g.100313  ORF Transcript_54755/g.100313 Transcript_54755/m.100313 type:complete len:103 (+) Transcript_54755:560-868(+)
MREANSTPIVASWSKRNLFSVSCKSRADLPTLLSPMMINLKMKSVMDARFHRLVAMRQLSSQPSEDNQLVTVIASSCSQTIARHFLQAQRQCKGTDIVNSTA